MLPKPDIDVVRCLARLEFRIGFLPYIQLPERLYERHREFIRSAPHMLSDEAEMEAALCMRDLVVRTNYKDFAIRLKNFIENKPLFDAVTGRSFVYILLEKSALTVDKKLISEAFEVIRPDDSDTSGLIDHLITLGEFQRCALHEHKKALDTLRRAQFDEKDSLRASNLAYRQACCCLDLDQAREAVELFERCIGILESKGYTDTSVNMMNTRLSYAVALMSNGQNEETLGQYLRLDETYRLQNRTDRPEYAVLMNNMAVLLHDMGRLEQAEQRIARALAIDAQADAPKNYLAGHKRNAALIYAHLGKATSALAMATQAIRKRKHFMVLTRHGYMTQMPCTHWPSHKTVRRKRQCRSLNPP